MVLETLGFILLAQSNSFHQSKVHSFSVAFSGVVYQAQSAYSQYIGLRDENEKLRKENAFLREVTLNVENPNEVIDFSGFDCVSATAVTSTYHLGNNFIIINKGALKGIVPESGVIGPEGLVGVVHSVSDHYASIMPIIHRTTQISAQLKRTEYFGIIDWKESDEQYVSLSDIPNHVKIEEGDTIVTRGSSGIFPYGLIIGFAESSTRDESSGFQKIKVKLATDFRKINSLYVIINHDKPELDSITQSTELWIEQ